MDNKKLFELFDEITQKLLKSNFNQNLSGFGVTIRGDKGGGFAQNCRKGPDYESIQNFVTTFRTFILDSDPISIRNISKIYDALPDSDDLKDRFQDAREKFNDFLDTSTFIRNSGENLSNRKIIDTYIYGEVLHLNKHDEFKRWISIGPMKDITYNQIVYILSTCGNFICYFNTLNKEYSSINLKE